MSYFRSLKQNKVYKLDDHPSGAIFLWISVFGHPNGSFIHGRGADIINDKSLALQLCNKMALPISEEEYLDEMKNYFAADKKLREQFIKKYSL
jgi:hypothetical protein